MSLNSSFVETPVPAPKSAQSSSLPPIGETLSQQAYEVFETAPFNASLHYFVHYGDCPARRNAPRRIAKIERIAGAAQTMFKAAFQYGFQHQQNNHFAETPQGQQVVENLQTLFAATKQAVKSLGWENHPDHVPVTRSTKQGITTAKALKEYRANCAGDKLQTVARDGFQAGCNAALAYAHPLSVN